MIDFLLKSTISLSVFLGFYLLVLEREKIHQFNRFYLLFSIVISFVIPFLTFEIIKIVPIVQNFDTIIESSFPISITQNQIEEKTNYLPYLLWSLYGLVCFIFLFRFGKNISKLIANSKSNPIVKYKNANLVLVNEKTLPHTFLNSIFINFNDYNNRNIEDELYTHELVHVTQKHTLDILFIEFLKAIFWFNPLFLFYKKAIQLNHEFLADEEIVKTYNNVPFYQNLLLKKGSEQQTIYLASNLNYLVTKKRLIMMTKSTSQKIAFFKKIAIVPILAGLIYFFCIEVVAQEKKIATNYETKISGINKKKTDTIKKKNIKLPRPKPTTCPEVETKNAPIEVKKIEDKNEIENLNKNIVEKLSDFDTKGKKEGYIYMKNGTYFFIKNDKNEIDYFNRWGFKVDEMGNKISKTDVKTLSEVSEKPEFEGGMQAFYAYFSQNFQIPQNFPKDNESKILYVDFIVEKDGSLSNFNILKDLDFGTGDEAIRVLKKSPKWKPGKINDEKVRVKYVIPIKIIK